MLKQRSLSVYLLGQVEFEKVLQLQQMTASDLVRRRDRLGAVFVCEHPPVITVGRSAPPESLYLSCSLIRTGKVRVVWVKRGGGPIVHCPGQVAFYPVLRLDVFGFTLGEYMRRLRQALVLALQDAGWKNAGQKLVQWSLYGRSGWIATVAIAARCNLVYHGAFVNVCPNPGLLQLVEAPPECPGPASSLVSELGRPVRTTAVRMPLVQRFAEVIGCDEFYPQSGHPWLSQLDDATDQYDAPDTV